MRSEDRDTAGNDTESEGHLDRRDADVLVVGEVGDEEAAGGAEVLGGAGGPEIEEGEGTGEGKGEGGESTPEGGGESGEDQAEGSQEVGEGGEEKGEEGGESEAEGGGGGPDQGGEVVFCRVEAWRRRSRDRAIRSRIRKAWTTLSIPSGRRTFNTPGIPPPPGFEVRDARVTLACPSQFEQTFNPSTAFPSWINRVFCNRRQGDST